LERIVVAAPGGQSARLLCPTAQVAIIDELEARIWVKASRPGIQLAARVVLPRTLDHDDGSPVEVILRGPEYDRPGHWQQLVLKDMPKLLAAQIRVMRSTPGTTVDGHEAFMDAVVLTVAGDPQGVEIEIDDLVVDGVLRTGRDDVQLASYPSRAVTAPTASGGTPGGARLQRLPDRDQPTNVGSTPSVELQGDLLLINNRPFVPRAVHWQGEPLKFLAERGFNAVWFDQPPTADQIANAARHGLWFICVPPRPEALARDGLGCSDERVIAWYLQDDAIENDANYARRWADLIRERGDSDRPIILGPQSNWKLASQTADVLLARPPHFDVISDERYEQWLSARSSLARPGTPIWVSAPTQFDEAVGRQIAALSGIATGPPTIEAPRLEALLYSAYVRGIRGFVFDSHSSLSEPDTATQLRANMLERINCRLQMIEPWLAAGKVIGEIPSADAAWNGIVLHVDRARLLVSVAQPQATKSNTAKEAIFIVPGIPESCQVYALSPAALRTLPMQRVAGGVRLVVRPNDDAFVLMTEDPQVVQGLRQRLARDAARVVRLERDRASLHAASIADAAHRLAHFGHNSGSSVQAAQGINVQLQQVDVQLAAGRLEQAYAVATSANHALEQAAAEQRQSVGQPTNLSSNPLALNHDRPADLAAFQRTVVTLRGGENLLYGGDFEDLGQVTQFGWQHFRDPVPGVVSGAELTTVEPKHGAYSLKLHAAADSTRTSAQLEQPATVWIQSPPIPIPSGRTIEITGWVRIDKPITGNDAGLRIVDSLGGQALSLSPRQTAGWERFHMIRGTADLPELRLTFALAGIGDAFIDAVMVRVLEQPTTGRLPLGDSARNNELRQ
jgi:hypothetical protein